MASTARFAGHHSRPGRFQAFPHQRPARSEPRPRPKLKISVWKLTKNLGIKSVSGLHICIYICVCVCDVLMIHIYICMYTYGYMHRRSLYDSDTYNLCAVRCIRCLCHSPRPGNAIVQQHFSTELLLPRFSGPPRGRAESETCWWKMKHVFFLLKLPKIVGDG